MAQYPAIVPTAVCTIQLGHKQDYYFHHKSIWLICHHRFHPQHCIFTFLYMLIISLGRCSNKLPKTSLIFIILQPKLHHKLDIFISILATFTLLLYELLLKLMPHLFYGLKLDPIRTCCKKLA